MLVKKKKICLSWKYLFISGTEINDLDATKKKKKKKEEEEKVGGEGKDCFSYIFRRMRLSNRYHFWKKPMANSLKKTPLCLLQQNEKCVSKTPRYVLSSSLVTTVRHIKLLSTVMAISLWWFRQSCQYDKNISVSHSNITFDHGGCGAQWLDYTIKSWATLVHWRQGCFVPAVCGLRSCSQRYNHGTQHIDGWHRSCFHIWAKTTTKNVGYNYNIHHLH